MTKRRTPSALRFGLVGSLVSGVTLFSGAGSALASNVITGTGQVHTVMARNQVLRGNFAGVVVGVDNVHVNLQQAVVDCSLPGASNVGVHLKDRTRVHINGGTIQNCTIGVLLGDIDHTKGGGGSKNHINNVTVTNAVLFGPATSFDGDGIVINTGVNNRVNGNLISFTGGGRVPFALPGGIRVYAGSDNDVAGNVVENVQDGAEGSIGIFIQRADNTAVHGNQVSNNAGHGIRVAAPANGNVITGNTALHNGGTDLVDDEANCGTNTWQGNQFGTVNQACIQ